jgi:hypothetical protein
VTAFGPAEPRDCDHRLHDSPRARPTTDGGQASDRDFSRAFGSSRAGGLKSSRTRPPQSARRSCELLEAGRCFRSKPDGARCHALPRSSEFVTPSGRGRPSPTTTSGEA